jgi:hypothetical protein
MQDFQDGKINSSQLWIKMPLEEKVKLIGVLKQNFREDDGVVINKSNEYYAILLDALYTEHPEFLMESLKTIFAAVAMKEDDFYEEGLDLQDSIEKWFGETFVIDQSAEEATQVK